MCSNRNKRKLAHLRGDVTREKCGMPTPFEGKRSLEGFQRNIAPCHAEIYNGKAPTRKGGCCTTVAGVRTRICDTAGTNAPENNLSIARQLATGQRWHETPMPDFK